MFHLIHDSPGLGTPVAEACGVVAADLATEAVDAPNRDGVPLAVAVEPSAPRLRPSQQM